MSSNNIPQLLSGMLQNNMHANFANQLGDLLSNAHSANLWRPQVDMIETSNTIKLFIFLPGIDPSTVDVEFFNNTIVIKGNRDYPTIETEDTTWLLQESSYGTFSRRVSLPISVTNRESVSVTTENGVMILCIDKSRELMHSFSVRAVQNPDDDNTDT
jgi:HSP20 family protein